jgi:hypothetical protein
MANVGCRDRPRRVGRRPMRVGREQGVAHWAGAVILVGSRLRRSLSTAASTSATSSLMLAMVGEVAGLGDRRS